MVAASAGCNGEQSLTDWLAVLHAPGVGSATFHRLLDTFGSPSLAVRAPAGELHRLGLTSAAVDAVRRPDRAALDRDLEWSQHDDNHIITCLDDAYPPLLRQLPDPPPLLYAHGRVELLGEPQLAMVGSRNPTRSGLQTATDFARHLGAAGLVITSGLALGVDAASHQGALDAEGATVAVAGTGLDRVYPAAHRDLARAIASTGVLVSEFPVGTPPLAENFPRRNRIISGLSLGTLVVEAALRSGSLITARLAAEQGREVFAIPGSIHNPLARGCHRLIREGAKLVETAQDVIDELMPLAAACAAESGAATAVAPELDQDYLQLIEIMGFDEISVDQLVENSGLTPAEVSSMLLQLEMVGQVATSHGGYYIRLK
ncbi:MAG: DNA-protecting protein DprA [Halobacteria archaeon]|nr:DNA-protecting protein DprA [Halobacteria archaeon]